MASPAEELAGAGRTALWAALGAGAVVAVVGFIVAGPLGLGLAAGGALIGLGNLQLAVYAMRRSPVAFLGSSLPRLAVITVVLALLVALLGPVGVWGLLGLLATHLAQVGAVLRLGWRLSQR